MSEFRNAQVADGTFEAGWTPLMILISYKFDLWSVIRYTGIDDETRQRIWDDGLHLTKDGYNIMGKAVAARLFELLQ